MQDAPLTSREKGLTAFGPVIDGELVTGPPWTAIGAGRDVDLICGFTHEECLGNGRPPAPAGIDLTAVAESVGLRPDAVDAYRHAYPGHGDADMFVTMLSDALVRMPTTWVAEAHAKAGGRTWLYDFSWRGAMGAAHGVDVPFTFGNPTSRFAARFLGTPPPADFDPLSEQIRAAWTAFATTGDPGWPRYDLDHRRTRTWDTTPSDAADPLAESRRIWQAAIPH